MFNIGMGEFLLFIMISFIVIGPEKLPETIRSLVHFYKKMKNLTQLMQNEVEKEFQYIEFQEFVKKELNKIQFTEQQLQQLIEQLHREIDTVSQIKTPSIAKHYLPISSVQRQYIKPPCIPFYYNNKKG